MPCSSWFIIINPTAGGGRSQKKWGAVQRQLNALGFDFDYAFTTHRHHAIALARQAVLQGYRCIAAMGGDGTAHEVVNGICQQTQVPSADIVFALLPVGTGNDWIKTHGLPKDCKAVLRLMQAERTLLHDIGHIHYYDTKGLPQRRYFLNVAGLGYDAFVTQISQEKRLWGSTSLTYFYLILSSLLRYRTTRMRVTMDHELLEGAIYSLAIGLGRYNGGGAQFVPHALPDDGLFALTAFKDIAAWEVVLQTPKFYNGTITTYPKAVARQVATVHIESLDAIPTLLEADGEYLGQTPAQFTLLPQALQVIIP